jgi:hypothetical protein
VPRRPACGSVTTPGTASSTPARLSAPRKPLERHVLAIIGGSTPCITFSFPRDHTPEQNRRAASSLLPPPDSLSLGTSVRRPTGVAERPKGSSFLREVFAFVVAVSVRLSPRFHSHSSVDRFGSGAHWAPIFEWALRCLRDSTASARGYPSPRHLPRWPFPRGRLTNETGRPQKSNAEVKRCRPGAQRLQCATEHGCGPRTIIRSGPNERTSVFQ